MANIHQLWITINNIQFGLLINFGLAFPLVYPIALFTNIIDI